MSAPKGQWWFSTDGRRGFNLSSVKAFDYRPQAEGRMVSTLYIYVEAGLFHLSSGEADTVFALIKGKGKA